MVGVRRTLGQFIEQRVPLRRRGRIRGKYQLHPLIVVGLVEYLLNKGGAESIDQAFRRLEGTADPRLRRGEGALLPDPARGSIQAHRP
jgi:hypothetical protein